MLCSGLISSSAICIIFKCHLHQNICCENTYHKVCLQPELQDEASTFKLQDEASTIKLQDEAFTIKLQDEASTIGGNEVEKKSARQQ